MAKVKFSGRILFSAPDQMERMLHSDMISNRKGCGSHNGILWLFYSQFNVFVSNTDIRRISNKTWKTFSANRQGCKNGEMLAESR